MFETVSKPGVTAQGVARLERAAASTSVPVLAIGGIDAVRAERCAAAGAAGVAAIGVFLPERCGGGALGPQRAVTELRAALAAGQARGRTRFAFPERGLLE